MRRIPLWLRILSLFLLIAVFVIAMLLGIFTIVTKAVKNSDAYAMTEKRYVGSTVGGFGKVDTVSLKTFGNMTIRKNSFNGVQSGVARFTVILHSGEKTREVAVVYDLGPGGWVLSSETPPQVIEEQLTAE